MSETFSILLPHVVLALAGALFLLAGTFAIPRRWFGPAALAVLALTAVMLRLSVSHTLAAGIDSGFSVRSSALAVGFQYCCLAVGALFVLQSISQQSITGLLLCLYILFLASLRFQLFSEEDVTELLTFDFD